MSFPINRTSLAAALAALAGAVIAKDPGGREVVLRPPPTLTAPTRIRKFQPFARARRYFEQGARECARRQGGWAWADFRAADRTRRGLPVSWPWMRGGA